MQVQDVVSWTTRRYSARPAKLNLQCSHQHLITFHWNIGFFCPKMRYEYPKIHWWIDKRSLFLWNLPLWVLKSPFSHTARCRHSPLSVTAGSSPSRLLLAADPDMGKNKTWWSISASTNFRIQMIQVLSFKDILVGGWALPRWKIWVRQMGLLFPIYGKIIQMFQTTNQYWNNMRNSIKLCLKYFVPDLWLSKLHPVSGTRNKCLALCRNWFAQKRSGIALVSGLRTTSELLSHTNPNNERMKCAWSWHESFMVFNLKPPKKIQGSGLIGSGLRCHRFLCVSLTCQADPSAALARNPLALAEPWWPCRPWLEVGRRSDDSDAISTISTSRQTAGTFKLVFSFL